MLLHRFLALAAIATPYASAQAIFPSSSTPLLITPTPTPTPTPSSTAPVASASASAPPTLVLVQPGTFIACATGGFEWRLRNVDPLLYTVTFRAHNSGVDQSIPGVSVSSSVTSTSSAIATITPTSTPSAAAVTTPLSSSRAIAAVVPSSSSSNGLTPFIRDIPSQPLIKRTTLNINQTLGTNHANYAYQLPIVALPQGRYMIVASVPELNIEESANFTVLESANKSCLGAFAALSLAATQSSTLSLSSSGTASSSRVAASSGAAVNGAAASAGNGVSVGAIVGGVIGGLAALGIAGLIIFCCIKRKRRRRNEGSGTWGSEATFRGGSGPATYITKPQRLSSGPTSPPSSSSSHDLNDINNQTPQTAQNPFATPPITTASDRYSKRRSIPLSPPARPESEVEPTPRRASSPIPVPPGSFDQNVFAGGGAVLARKPSAKRKAVPSLGPELRKEMAKTGSGAGSGGSGGRKEFKLMPDMPGALAGTR